MSAPTHNPPDTPSVLSRSTSHSAMPFKLTCTIKMTHIDINERCLLSVDEMLGRIVDAVDAVNATDNTCVCIRYLPICAGCHARSMHASDTHARMRARLRLWTCRWAHIYIFTCTVFSLFCMFSFLFCCGVCACGRIVSAFACVSALPFLTCVRDYLIICGLAYMLSPTLHFIRSSVLVAKVLYHD